MPNNSKYNASVRRNFGGLLEVLGATVGGIAGGYDGVATGHEVGANLNKMLPWTNPDSWQGKLIGSSNVVTGSAPGNPSGVNRKTGSAPGPILNDPTPSEMKKNVARHKHRVRFAYNGNIFKI